MSAEASPAVSRAVVDVPLHAAGEHPKHFVVVVHGHPELLQVVLALTVAGRFASLLDRREQDCHQHGDDGNHNQEFNERKAMTAQGDGEHGATLKTGRRGDVCRKNLKINTIIGRESERVNNFVNSR